MSYGSPSAFDIGDADDVFAFGVETHEAVWVQAGFDKPHTVFIIDGHAVWPRVFASRHPPFFYLECGRYDLPEIPFRIIHIPDCIIGSDYQSSRPCFCARQ